MDYFAQQLINGLVLGSIYGLIAIGYTMVYGIVGMINFAHGDIFMIGGFIALISFLILVSFGLTAIPLILLDRAAGLDGDHRALRLDGGAHRLSAAAAFVPPRADALGHRHVVRADQLFAGGAGRAGQAGAADHHRRLHAARRRRRLRRAAFQRPDRRRHHHHRAARCCSPGWCRAPGSAATCAPASRTRPWRRCSASTSTAPSP